jgi:hypothetical protein
LFSEPFSPDVGKPPENGFKTQPFSPDVGKPTENGFKTQPFSPDVGKPTENRSPGAMAAMYRR